MTEEPSESPTNAVPSEPPLSIAHLMAWAACVAVYMSFNRTIALFFELQDTSGAHAVQWAISGMSRGTGLAGILLLVARRVRGLKFPRRGGEMLWIIVGIQAVSSLLQYPMMILSSVWSTTFSRSLFTLACGLFILAVWAAVYLYAILQAETRRWRVVFVVLVATSVAAPVLTALAARSYGVAGFATIAYIVPFVHSLVVTTTVLIVSFIDLRQPQPYPWTHWTGVVLYLLQFGVTTFWFFAMLIMQS